MIECIYETQGEQVIGNQKGFILPKEEIVRCRDCELEMNGYCSRPDEWNDDLWFPVEPDGFCAWGEKKAVDNG